MAIPSRVIKQYVSQNQFYERLITGGSSKATTLGHAIKLAARGTKSPVLIVGDTGSGKELVARAIHEESINKEHPFIVANLSEVPSPLRQEYLFGHEKGSYTGATSARIGAIQQAGLGSLLIDEVDSISLELQAAMLRILDGYNFTRVGGMRRLETGARFMFTTNKNLIIEKDEGRLRDDFYHRIVWGDVVRVPSLCERSSDIPSFIKLFTDEVAKHEGHHQVTFSEDAITYMMTSYHWPGSVRQLKHVVRYFTKTPNTISARDVQTHLDESRLSPVGARVSLHNNSRTRADDFVSETLREAKASIQQGEPKGSIGLSIKNLERSIVASLRDEKITVATIAKLFGCDAKTIYRKLKLYDEASKNGKTNGAL